MTYSLTLPAIAWPLLLNLTFLNNDSSRGGEYLSAKREIANERVVKVVDWLQTLYRRPSPGQLSALLEMRTNPNITDEEFTAIVNEELTTTVHYEAIPCKKERLHFVAV